MTKYGIDPTVICQIIDLANRHHIKTVILFGSRARGDFRRTSDIDLAVQGGNVCRFRLDVEEETHTLLTFDVIDLCSDLSPELREAISKEEYCSMKKFDNYRKNLDVLRRSDQQDLNNEFIISGIIDKFSIQFELGWKVLKELLTYEGIDAAKTGSLVKLSNKHTSITLA